MLRCGGLIASKVLTSTVPSLHYSLFGRHARLRDEYCSDCGVGSVMHKYGRSRSQSMSLVREDTLIQNPVSTTYSPIARIIHPLINPI